MSFLANLSRLYPWNIRQVPAVKGVAGLDLDRKIEFFKLPSSVYAIGGQSLGAQIRTGGADLWGLGAECRLQDQSGRWI